MFPPHDRHRFLHMVTITASSDIEATLKMDAVYGEKIGSHLPILFPMFFDDVTRIRQLIVGWLNEALKW